MKYTKNMKKAENNKGIVLLSGGLDSLVSLHCASKEMEIVLALTFDYGQKALLDEIEAAEKIASKYKINHKIIKLPFLKEITNNALVDSKKGLEFKELGIESARAVWVPNRNGLFLNIAASFADSMNLSHIIFGANKEEAETFSDNSKDFNLALDNLFKFSTNVHPKIYAPCVNLEKYEIINLGIKEGVDFTLLKSCYDSNPVKKHCGKCESCKRLYAAILKSNNKDLINLIF